MQIFSKILNWLTLILFILETMRSSSNLFKTGMQKIPHFWLLCETKKNINFVEDQPVSIYTKYYLNFISGGFIDKIEISNFTDGYHDKDDEDNDDRCKMMTVTHMTLFIRWPKEFDTNNYTSTWILRTKQTFSRSPVPLSLPMILIWSRYAGSLRLYFSTLYSPVWMFK